MPRPARPVAPITPLWVWIAFAAVTIAIGGIGYWAFYLPLASGR